VSHKNVSSLLRGFRNGGIEFAPFGRRFGVSYAPFPEYNLYFCLYNNTLGNKDGS